jgi:hypothetical protein
MSILLCLCLMRSKASFRFVLLGLMVGRLSASGDYTLATKPALSQARLQRKPQRFSWLRHAVLCHHSMVQKIVLKRDSVPLPPPAARAPRCMALAACLLVLLPVTDSFVLAPIFRHLLLARSSLAVLAADENRSAPSLLSRLYSSGRTSGGHDTQ